AKRSLTMPVYPTAPPFQVGISSHCVGAVARTFPLKRLNALHTGAASCSCVRAHDITRPLNGRMPHVRIRSALVAVRRYRRGGFDNFVHGGRVGAEWKKAVHLCRAAPLVHRGSRDLLGH